MKPLIPPDSALRTALDAIPSYILITDGEYRILDTNRAARALSCPGDALELNKRMGDAMRCVFARDASQGCGTSEFCPSCVLRSTARRALAGESVRGQLGHMILTQDGDSTDFWFTVSAAAIALEGRDVVLVTLEDVTELVETREFLPLCPGCMEKRELGNQESQAHEFLMRHPGALLPQELCTTCNPDPPVPVPPRREAPPS
jgi:hypothetical protein